MALTLAQLLGTPVHASEWDLNDALEQFSKSTAGSSAIAAGRVVTLHGGTAAIATSGSTGRMGIVPALAPLNVDADSKLKVITRVGAQYFAEANGAIPVGAQCLPDTGGKVKAGTGAQGFAIYRGHDGEGTIGNPATAAIAGDPIKIELTGQVV